ncbi:MAG: hypothetical protein ACLTEH_01070 [Clostridia bacterium]
MRKRYGFLKTLGAYALGMVAIVIAILVLGLTGWLVNLIGWDWFKTGWLGMIIGSVLTLIAIAIGIPIINHFFGGRRRHRREEEEDDE